MQRLEQVHLVQFFLFEALSLRFDPTTAIIAPNGAGKSALLDALQIVLLGGDRSRIRFNAQAGGSHRARTIRDYCLGVFQPSGEHRRDTATTYISLVFRDEATGQPLTAGIALGASVNEADHRMHGLYLLPGIDLGLDDHVERIKGQEFPLEWPAFRELVSRRCKQAGTAAEFHSVSERFVKDLLFRLRASPTAQPDINAFRKAFQNALNLQRVEDVDLFVRTLVAEDRPTDIARFRAVLDTFRLLKEKIEQVAHRIQAAEAVDQLYGKIAHQVTRAASARALGAEYARDLLAEQVDMADEAWKHATRHVGNVERQLQQARSDRETTQHERDEADRRLRSSAGYGEQAGFEELSGRDREALHAIKRELMRPVSDLRTRLKDAAALNLPTVDARHLRAVTAEWDALFAELSGLAADAALPWAPEQLHQRVITALDTLAPIRVAVDAHARQQLALLEQAKQRLQAARQNQHRLAAGQSALRDEVVRLQNYLEEAGIPARPICDLVRIADPAWQGAIEAYLRTHVDALLIPAQHEQEAVRIYRGLQGHRAVYGVKIALGSHTRAADAQAEAGSVAALIQGEDPDAIAYLRRQLGRMACADSEAELIRSRQGLSRDGLVAKGGGIERLRLPAATELRIGATDNRERLRQLRQDLETAQRDLSRIEPAAYRAQALQQGLSRFADAQTFAAELHDAALRHREAEGRYRARQASQEALRNPDLVQLSEHAHALGRRWQELDTQVQALSGQLAVAHASVERELALKQELTAQFDAAAHRASAAFRDPDVDPERVERQRLVMDERWPDLNLRIQRCEERARASDDAVRKLLPDAWSQLAQYIKDHGISIDFPAEDWRAAKSLLAAELTHLRSTELVNYQSQAEEAYRTAVDTFRSNVASTLYDNFTKLRHQINTLNRTLRSSPAFSNNERYQFHFEVTPECRDLHRFIQRVAEVGPEDNLFGAAGEVPDAFRDIIEERVAPRGAAPSPLDDYRRFFSFEVQIRQDDRIIGSLSERMRSGSGGEHRAPLYVIAGAALAAAYGKSEAQPGGMGLILLDEFGDKIDAQNARATTNYLRSLGLQLILAAPDTAQGTLSGVLDSYIELFRDGDLLHVERIEITEQGRDLLQSDQFDLHPELLATEVARIARAQAAP
jgi:uncharacterized protein YPO0396